MTLRWLCATAMSLLDRPTESERGGWAGCGWIYVECRFYISVAISMSIEFRFVPFRMHITPFQAIPNVQQQSSDCTIWWKCMALYVLCVTLVEMVAAISFVIALWDGGKRISIPGLSTRVNCMCRKRIEAEKLTAKLMEEMFNKTLLSFHFELHQLVQDGLLFGKQSWLLGLSR